jgi:hypothetical protein
MLNSYFYSQLDFNDEFIIGNAVRVYATPAAFQELR